MKVADDPARPLTGNVYAFRTAPYSEFAVTATGRFAAFKVLKSDKKCVVIAVLDGIWSASPAPAEVRRASILREYRLAHSGQLAVFGMHIKGWAPSELGGLVLLTNERVTAEETIIADRIASFAAGSRFSTLLAANYAAEGEWRWAHERDAFLVEAERERARDEAKRIAHRERYRTRMSKLTWDQLLAETPFERWSPSPPFPPEEFVIRARTVVRDAQRDLRALGARPRKSDVRAILKTCVEWFNHADVQAGGVIETEEREDICAALEEMAYVARQKELVHEIDNWRSW